MPHVRLSALNQNVELYYEVHGSGKNKILFIMGMLHDASSWLRQTDFFRLQPEYQCVSYDNRGCGRSSSPSTFKYSTTQMAKDAIALIDHLEWSQCHIVGVSMGGMIALEFALLAPERILSLTLLSTHAGGLTGMITYAGFRSLLRSIMTDDEHLNIDLELGRLYGTKTHDNPKRRKLFYEAHCKRIRDLVPSPLIGVIGQVMTTALHYVSYADLLKIRYSPFDCIIMVGTEDVLIPKVNSYIIQRVLGCQLLTFERAGHGIQSECAEEINEELLNWYESIRINGPPKLKCEIPEEYKTEIKALEQCCQHRTHCLIHDIVGFIKGLFLGIILYILLTVVGFTKVPIAGFHLNFESVILLGCLNGVHRAISCVYHAFNARRYAQEHQLVLNQASKHGGIGVALPGEPKNGIPHGCGFEFPLHSIIFIISLIGVIYSIIAHVQKSDIIMYDYK